MIESYVGPPRVIVDEQGVTASWQKEEDPNHCILWSEIESVVIQIVVISKVGYSEGFWILTGSRKKFGAPVELVAGGEELNKRLFKLPGFDFSEYQKAREAEAMAVEKEFICWRCEANSLNQEEGVS